MELIIFGQNQVEKDKVEDSDSMDKLQAGSEADQVGCLRTYDG